ncbi:MAG: efflux RND transporter periplasmic adaptor subunit [Candidatus Cloacimonadaceae bacterium]|nr:efflux RND transporter periplasmic adaptor subunit [Candidatus Cloacimonadaceae bacterium]
MSKTIILIPIIAMLLMASCKSKDASGGKPMRSEDTQPVMVEELNLRPIDEFILVSGKLEGIVNITMNSETSGRILELNKKLGDRVQKGERIGRVENEVLKIRLAQAEAALLSAQVGLDNATRNASYAEETFRRKLISEVEYNSVRSALKGAQAGFDGAKAGVEASRTAYNNSYLMAPESGTISNLMVSVGQVINPNQAVAQITDARVLLLKTGVGESQIAKIRQGQSVEISYPGLQESLSAVVRGFGISPMPGSATYPVEIELRNKGNLMPGMVVSAKILSNRLSNMLYTTLTNIVREFDKSYLYVVESDTIAVRRPVQLGNVIGENVILLSGVEPGEKIVVSGSENLEDGIKVRIRK